MSAAAKHKVGALVLGCVQDRLDPAPESCACKRLGLPGASSRFFWWEVREGSSHLVSSEASPAQRRVKTRSRQTLAQCQQQMVLTAALQWDQPSHDVEGCPACICAIGSYLSQSEALPTPPHRGRSWALGAARPSRSSQDVGPWRSVWPQHSCPGNRGSVTRAGSVTSQGTPRSSGQKTGVFSVFRTHGFCHCPQRVNKLHSSVLLRLMMPPPCDFQVLRALPLHGAGGPVRTQANDRHPGQGGCLGQKPGQARGPSAPASLHRDVVTGASVPPEVQHHFFLSGQPPNPWGAGRPGARGDAEVRCRTPSPQTPPSPHAPGPSTPKAKPPKCTPRRPPGEALTRPPACPQRAPTWPFPLPRPRAVGLATASGSTHTLPNLSTLRARASLIVASGSLVQRRTKGSGEQSCPWDTGTNTAVKHATFRDSGR